MYNKKLYNQIINSISKVVKKQINEAFDFNSLNKQKKYINGSEIINVIIQRINKRINLLQEDYNILTLYTGIYKVKDKEELKDLINYFIDLFGNNCNLNWIDVSDIISMDNLFYNSKFNGDISKWDVSNVTSMQSMFEESEFNGDISEWDVSNVNNMFRLFNESSFNNDISKWDVSNVTDMYAMFGSTEFTGDISKWNVSNVTTMEHMFYNSKFNGDISNWNIDKVNNMRNMFSGSKFNRDISNWNVGRAYTYNMFDDCHIKAEYKPKNIYGY